MNSTPLIYKSITEIATVERTQKGRLYPTGTVYIQVSACKRAGQDAWMISESEGPLEDKYAVVLPNIEINPKYLKLALEAVTPDWHRRYVGTNINISMDAFKYLKIYYTPNIKEQLEVVEAFSVVDKEIELIEKQIEAEKTVKKWFLRKLFP